MTPAVHAYHDATKHHFHRFARSLGYLDWASQPNPFRSFAGADAILLPPNPQSAVRNPQCVALGDVLRHALGLSAWKQFGASRWALRVNPSSGNLHPTEAYVIAGAMSAPGGAPAVYHYAADRHALERRCTFEASAWPAAADSGSWLIALTSIHWREAWKYGERAFRYCQHDMGHAMAAIRIAAAIAGYRAALLPEWSHADIAALTGIDRDQDYIEAEREEPGCLLLIRNPQSAIRNPQYGARRQPRCPARGCPGWLVDRPRESVERRSHDLDVHRRDRRRDERSRSQPAVPSRPSCPSCPSCLSCPRDPATAKRRRI